MPLQKQIHQTRFLTRFIIKEEIVSVDIVSVSGPEAVCQVIGMYDYVAQNDDELAFLKGQVITVLSKDDCDWWKGELNGREGLFPSNYVKLTTDTDPSTQCEYAQTHTHKYTLT